MTGPRVSVVIPVHGRAPFLGQALESVAAQTYEHHEVLVVLDGPCSELPNLRRQGVRVLERPHGGVGAARNTGIGAASGELIALLDQDDQWRSDKLERQVGLLESRPRLDFVLSHLDVRLEPGTDRPEWLDPTWLTKPVPGFIPSTWLVRRETFAEAGEFDERYEIACDTDWLARANLGAWRREMLDEPLVHWRIHDENASHDLAAIYREVLTMMRRHTERKRAARELRVGAVIAARDYEDFIGPAIDSLLAQTMRPSAVVVVDDGSSDRTGVIASGYGPPVRVVRLAGTGIGAARSRGVAELPEVDVVSMLDADDLLTPDSIERRAQVLSVRPDVDIVFGHGRRFERVTDGEPVPSNPLEPMPTIGLMLARVAALERVGPFATGVRVADGLDWLLRARELGLRDVTVPELVYWRRVHGANNSLTNRGAFNEFPRALKASLDRRRAAERSP